MADPYDGRVIAGHAGKIHAGILGVGARLPRHGETVQLGLLSGAGFHGVRQDVHQLIGRAGLLVYLGSAAADEVSVQNDLSLLVLHASEGDRLPVIAVVGDGRIGGAHLDGGDAGGAQGEAGTVQIDLRGWNAQALHVCSRRLDPHVLHQDPSGDHIQGLGKASPHRGEPIGAAGGKPAAGIAFLCAPAGDSPLRIDDYGRRGHAFIEGRPVDRQGLDTGAHLRKALGSPVQAPADQWLVTAADDGP